MFGELPFNFISIKYQSDTVKITVYYILIQSMSPKTSSYCVDIND